MVVGFNSGVLRILNYLVAGISIGGATGAFEQQDVPNITPHAAAAIAIILMSFIGLFGVVPISNCSSSDDYPPLDS